MSLQYSLNSRDKELIAAAGLFLRKAVRASVLTPAQVVTAAKILHAVERVPLPARDVNASVSIQGPARWFGEIETWHWWEVKVEERVLSILSGGHFYRKSTGGDSFTTLSWTVAPGEEAEYDDYLEDLRIVPDVQPFELAVKSLDFSKGPYTPIVSDADNALLDGEEEEEDEELELEDEEHEENVSHDGHEESESPAIGVGQSPSAPGEETTPMSSSWAMYPTGPAEERLAQHVRKAEVDANEPEFAFGVETCDVCRCSLMASGFFVDGMRPTNGTWANMCASCFAKEGAAIAWGKGQLYARQADGDWRMVAGFRP